MKRILHIASIIGLIAGLGKAAQAGVVYTTPIVTGVQTSSTSFPLNLNTAAGPQTSIDRMAVQVNWSNQSATNKTFTDGGESTGTFIVNSVNGLVLSSATDSVTVAANSVIQSSASYDSLTVISTNGLTGAIITVNGNTVKNNGWRIDVSSDTAADIATQISAQIYQVLATASGSNVSLVARTKGTAGNAYTLASSTPSAISVSSPTFIGGKNPAFQNQSITINGVVYPRASYWNQPNTGDDTSTGTAISLAALFNTVKGITATSAGSVVYATATVAGSAGNLFTISASTTALTIGTPNFTGGVDNAKVCINGTCLTQGTDWTKGATTALTAASITSAINGNSVLAPLVTATTVASSSTITSDTVGTATNYTLTSSTQSQISASNPTMTGGTNSAYTINTTPIAIPTHGFAQGQAVLYTSGTITIAPLVNQTTYYVGYVDANDVKLASSTVQAAAGNYLVYTSSSVAGPHTFTLAPLSTTGTASFKWQYSNDCVTYNDIPSISSTTIASPYTTSSQNWDFGNTNYKCIQMNYIAPTTGGINLQAIPNGKN